MIITANGPQNVGQIKTYFELGELFLSPKEYQREGIWKQSQKQLLIDTIFRGMDIPKLYLWKINEQTLSNNDRYPDGDTKDLYRKVLDDKRKENDDPNPHVFEVVDGQQRIRTILEYMGVEPPNDNVYRGPWHETYKALLETPMAKGRMYSQLNAGQRTKFDQGALTVMVLEDASIEEIRDMFLRLQNGTPLNAQQKRDAMGSSIGKVVQDLAASPFFERSVNFGNNVADHHFVISQMLYLELKGKIVQCGSRRLDPLYAQYKNVPVDTQAMTKAKRVIRMLGQIFTSKNPHLNRRSYVLSLYWALSRILEVYDIKKGEYSKIRENFERLDSSRIEAADRDYAQEPSDDIYAELSDSMARGTDSADKISARHDIISQFLFNNVALSPKADLDPRRAFSYEEKLILYRKAGGFCQLAYDGIICGRHINDFDDAVVDHVRPHSKGGNTTLGNGRIAYKTCNTARGTRDDFDPTVHCHRLSDS